MMVILKSCTGMARKSAGSITKANFRLWLTVNGYNLGNKKRALCVAL